MLNKTHIEIKHILGDEYLWGLINQYALKTVFNRLNDFHLTKISGFHLISE